MEPVWRNSSFSSLIYRRRGSKTFNGTILSTLKSQFSKYIQFEGTNQTKVLFLLFSPFEMNSTLRNFMRQNSSSVNAEVEKSLDIFKLGLMMLECAIGGL